MLTLIKNVMAFAPANLGICDILTANGKIERIFPGGVNSSCSIPDGVVGILDGSGKIAVPGFIDLHAHITGGGGEGGFAGRTPEAIMTDFTLAGVTTVHGLLGTDGVTRTPEALLAKTNALNCDGITCLMSTGAYGFPSPTITGSVERDIMLISPVIGCKISLSDHRSGEITKQEFFRLASDVRRGGLLSGKAGLLTIHIGDGKNMLSYLFAAMNETDIPLSTFLPTHLARNTALFDEAIRYIRYGGFGDFTAGEDGGTARFVRDAVNQGADIAHITISSDAFGSLPKFDKDGHCTGLSWDTSRVLHDEFVRLVKTESMSISDSLRFFTENPAARLGLSGQKGTLQNGADADILLLDKDLSIDTVMAKGKIMVSDGKITAFDSFGR